MKNNCQIKRNLNTFDIIGILILSTFIPSTIFLFKYVKNKSINFVYLTSILYVIIILLLVVFTLIFKKDYLKAFFSCHSKEERSFKFFHHNFSVCARCTGILIGMLITPLVTLAEFNYLYLIILIIPLIVDGLIQHKTSYESNNIKRLITGLLFGVGFIVLLAYGLLLYSKFVIQISKLIT